MADLNAMACCLDLMSERENADYKAFFEGYAFGYSGVFTEEMILQRLKTNRHSPNKYRVNEIINHFQEFYDTYGVKEGDGMYLAPEERLIIW